MKIKAYEGAHGRTKCPLCGRMSGSQRMGRLTTDGEETLVDTICDRCLEAGPQGAAESMKHHADWLRRQARTLEFLAPEVESIDTSGWPGSGT